jgi:hypothetical protein
VGKGNDAGVGRFLGQGLQPDLVSGYLPPHPVEQRGVVEQHHSLVGQGQAIELSIHPPAVHGPGVDGVRPTIGFSVAVQGQHVTGVYIAPHKGRAGRLDDVRTLAALDSGAGDAVQVGDDKDLQHDAWMGGVESFDDVLFKGLAPGAADRLGPPGDGHWLLRHLDGWGGGFGGLPSRRGTRWQRGRQSWRLCDSWTWLAPTSSKQCQADDCCCQKNVHSLVHCIHPTLSG